jgi:hypothetical protein
MKPPAGVTRVWKLWFPCLRTKRLIDALPVGRITGFLEEGKNVAVHCRQGVGRSGLIAAGALMSSGIATEEAIDLVGIARGLTVPETPDQLEWLRHLPSAQLAQMSS